MDNMKCFVKMCICFGNMMEVWNFFVVKMFKVRRWYVKYCLIVKMIMFFGFNLICLW